MRWTAYGTPPETASRVCVLLHGFGGDGRSFDGLIAALELTDTCWVIPESEEFADPPFKLRSWWKFGLFDAIGAYLTNHLQPHWLRSSDAFLRTAKEIERTVESIRRNTRRNERRERDAVLIVGGFSQGAVLAMQVALDLPDVVDRVLFMCGAPIDVESWKTLIESSARLKPLRVLQIHGLNDWHMSIEGARELDALLSSPASFRAGVATQFLVHPEGHRIFLDYPGILDGLRRFFA